MIILAPNTAATLRLGPFVDNEDGYTPEVALVIQKADVRLSKNGAAFAAAHADQGTGDVGADHDENGWYEISLDTTDTNTEGYLTIAIAVAGALPVWQDVWVTDMADDLDDLADAISSTTLTTTSPVSSTGTVTVYRGVDYSETLGNAIEFELPASTHGDLSAATCELRSALGIMTAEIDDGNTEDQLARIELTATESLELKPGTADYLLVVTLATGAVPTPKASGSLVVLTVPSSTVSV